MAVQIFQAQSNNANVDNFRTWGKGLSDALTAVGVLRTADTGQITDWTTLALPAASSYTGYEIRVLSTPAGFPVYMKIEYGAQSAATSMAIRIQLGSGTNGAGTLTGSLSSIFTLTPSSGSTTFPCYVSGDSSRVSFLMFVGTSGGSVHFSVGRRKDATGNDTDLGVNIVAGYNSGIQQQCLPKPTLGSAYPASPMNAVQCLCPPSGTASYSGDTGIFPVFVNLGAPENPDMGACIFCSGDFASASLVEVAMYGKTFRFITGGGNLNPTTNGNSLARVAMRYE